MDDIHTPITIDNASAEYPLLEKWVNDRAKFKTEVYGGHGFHIARPSDSFNGLMLNSVEKAIDNKIDVKYSFLRLSTTKQDSDIRIHVDSMMEAKYAWVLYFTDPPVIAPWDEGSFSEQKYGTAFFKHIKHGKEFTPESNPFESNRLITEDSWDLSKWKMYKVCTMKKNRLLIFPTSLFHCRYPFKGWGNDKTNGRVVSVGFFNILNDER